MSRPNQLPFVTCPACAGRAFARRTGKCSATFREVYYECRNPDACGHKFVVEMLAVRTVKPSRYPRPLHILPLTTWRETAANDDAVNDNAPPADLESDAGT